jgi:flagellin
MSMSVNMYSGLNALLSINSELSLLQTQATTGKRVNSAADDLTAFISASAYNNRAKSISDVNTTLSNNLATISAAKSGADQIRKTISDTLALLKDASQTQSYVLGTGGTDSTADAGLTNVNSGVLTGVKDDGAANNNFNINTALVGANFNLKIGNQAIKQGAIYTVKTATGTQTFKIAAAAEAVSGSGDGSSLANAAKVTTVGDLLNVLTAAGMTVNNRPAGAATNIANTNIQMSFSAAGGVQFTQNAKATDGTTSDLTQMFVSVRNKGAGNPATWTADDVPPALSSGLVSAGNQQFTIIGQTHTMSGGVNGRTADIKRANAASAYDAAIKTINQYLSDASVSGVNLLNGEKIKVTFNEKGISLDIQVLNGANPLQLSAKGLGLVDATTLASVDTAAKFANNYDNGDNGSGVGLMSAIDKLTTALTTVDLASSQVSTFQNTIQDRKDFNADFIKLLNASANDLTAADMAEVSTRAAALQVQQGFAQTMLVNTKQSDQSILQLLR